MRVLFLSDTHVGFARRTRIYPERREDAIKGMKNALKIAEEKNVDVVLHGGDLFDTRRPDAILIHEVMDLVSSLPRGSYTVRVETLKGDVIEEREVRRLPFIAVHGNHDFMEGEKNLYTLLSHLPNFFYAHKKKVTVEGDNGKICVVGMGYIPDRYALSYIKQYEGVSCPHTSFFLFHQPVEGLYPTIGREKPLPPAAFPSGFDYYLGGHLHWIVDKTIAGRRFLIPGSTVVTRLKEGEMEKPRIVYLIEGRNVSPIEIPGVRRAYRVEVEGGILEVQKAVEEVLKRHEGIPPLVKIVLVGERKGSVSEESLRKHFQGKALIYLFDRREDVFAQKLREIRRSIGDDAFSEELFIEEVKKLLGDEWSEEMKTIIEKAVEGDDEAVYNALMGIKKERQKRGGILDWT